MSSTRVCQAASWGRLELRVASVSDQCPQHVDAASGQRDVSLAVDLIAVRLAEDARDAQRLIKHLISIKAARVIQNEMAALGPEHAAEIAVFRRETRELVLSEVRAGS